MWFVCNLLLWLSCLSSVHSVTSPHFTGWGHYEHFSSVLLRGQSGEAWIYSQHSDPMPALCLHCRVLSCPMTSFHGCRKAGNQINHLSPFHLLGCSSSSTDWQGTAFAASYNIWLLGLPVYQWVWLSFPLSREGSTLLRHRFLMGLLTHCAVAVAALEGCLPCALVWLGGSTEEHNYRGSVLPR